MSQPPLPPELPTPADPDDDQHWFDLVAGRSVPDASAAARADAAWLRAALLSYRTQAPVGGPAAGDVRIARLLARARAEGVLPAATDTRSLGAEPAVRPQPMQARWWKIGGGRSRDDSGNSRTPRWGVALAASLAVLGVGLLLLRQPGDDTVGPEVMRGAALQQISAADPAQRRAQLLQSLQAAGFDAQPFDRLDRPGIDIALPVPLLAAQAQALRALGLHPPGGPTLQVEFLTVPRQAASAP